MTPLDRYATLVDDTEAFYTVCQQSLPYVVRINTIKGTRERVIKELNKAGVGWKRIDWTDMLLELETTSPGRTWPYFLGWIHGQEEVSAIPPLLINPGSNDRIWDACAAPGSKSTQLAALMNDDGLIVANDKSIGRLASLRSNTERLGITNVAVTNQDARNFSLNPFEFDLFDATLVDPPCSGEGTVRKNPRVFDNWSLEFIQSISSVQKAILQRAIQATKNGHTVVYSTCTFAPEENEGVLNHVLHNQACELVDIDLPIRSSPGITEWNGTTYDSSVQKARRIYPHQNDTGGFFCAKLEVGA